MYLLNIWIRGLCREAAVKAVVKGEVQSAVKGRFYMSLRLLNILLTVGGERQYLFTFCCLNYSTGRLIFTSAVNAAHTLSSSLNGSINAALQAAIGAIPLLINVAA